MNKLVINLDVTRIHEGVFKETPPEIPLELDIYFNDEKIFAFDNSLRQSNFCKELTNLVDNKPCSLRFAMNNKTPEHTRIDEAGNIVGDCRIGIANLTFDDISLGQLLIDHAVYAHNKNTADAQVENYKFYGEMGCNGTVELQFYTPIYLWLLENM